MEVMDTLYRFLDFLNGIYPLVAVFGSIATIILSLRKKWYFGAIIPVLSFFIALYWLQNPLPSWQKAYPIMTAMNILLWFPLTLLFTVVFVVCRVIRKERKSDN